MRAALVCWVLGAVSLTPVGASVVVSEGALCKDVALQVGQELHLALGANPTTGYRWRCAWAPAECLRMIRDEYVAASGEGQVGSGGTQHYTLVAVTRGACRVDLQYARPWAGGEGETPRSLHVVVSGNDTPSPPVALTEADCVPNTAVAPGDYLAVMLVENPTTGFSWRTWWTPEEALRKLHDRYLLPPGPVMPGRGGRHRWVFKALAPGTAVVYFQNRQPWSGGEQDLPRLLVLQVTEG